MNKNPTSTSQKAPSFQRRIGNTTYHITVRFNPDAKETATEKISRMIRNEILAGRGKCA